MSLTTRTIFHLGLDSLKDPVFSRSFHDRQGCTLVKKPVKTVLINLIPFDIVDIAEAKPPKAPKQKNLALLALAPLVLALHQTPEDQQPTYAKMPLPELPMKEGKKRIINLLRPFTRRSQSAETSTSTPH